MLCDEGLDAFLNTLESAETVAGLWSGVVTFFAGRLVEGVVHIVAPAPVYNGNASLRIMDSLDGTVRRLCGASHGGRSACAVLGPLLIRRRPDLIDLGPSTRKATGSGISTLHLTLVDHGFRAVLALPLPGCGFGHGPAGMLLLSRREVASFASLLRTDGACLVLAASHAHDRLLRLAASEVDLAAAAAPSLTNREGEVLTLSARGLTTRELGERMGISVSAVNFHLANAGRKLNTTNRTHAVSRAISLRLIDP